VDTSQAQSCFFKAWCIAILAVSKLSTERRSHSWVVLYQQPKGIIMLKIAALTGALAIGLVGGAYAQNTGPAPQTDMNKPSMTNSNSNAVQKSGTTGAASGGGSGMTDRGGANGTPNTVPKTTTGPTGPASKTDSPAK
jgi:hypothetical protein